VCAKHTITNNLIKILLTKNLTKL